MPVRNVQYTHFMFQIINYVLKPMYCTALYLFLKRNAIIVFSGLAYCISWATIGLLVTRIITDSK